MKKIILIAVSVLFYLIPSNAQVVKTQEFESEIKSAVIYLNGAEIIQNPKVNLQAGRTKLIFNDISPKINPKSIRVTTAKGIDLLSVTSKINYLTKIEQKTEIKLLTDSLDLITVNIQSLYDEKDAFTVEKDMLLKNTSIAGQTSGVVLSELKQTSDFYRSKIKEINTNISRINRELNKLNLSKNRINLELITLNANANYMRAQVEILVSAEQTMNSNFELKYLVSDAGWSPAYDIKAVDTDKPVELIYRAKVFNNTGIDWTDLNIKLSTADPSLSVSQPDLQPWYLSYNTYSSNNSSYGRADFAKSEGYTQNMIVSDEEAGEVGPGTGLWSGIEPSSGGVTFVTESFSSTAVPELSAEFEIKTKYSIPSDDKPYLVDVSEHQLPATYKHFAVTKLDKDVFLLARITGWEDLNLVEGPANVYYAGTYLGQSFIQTRNVKDTLELSLGRDSKVLVTRSKLKEFSSTQFIGSKRKETFTYEFVVKNNRKSDITIEILDQLPISQSDEIEVKEIEISQAGLNSATGELKWKYTVSPGESKKIRLSFYIKYPKDMNLEVQKLKERQVRYF